MATLKCPKCGTFFDAPEGTDQIFCYNCGERLNIAQPVQNFPQQNSFDANSYNQNQYEL